MDVVIGVDGGGTSTKCAVATTDGFVLGQAVAGPSNYQAIGVAESKASIRKAIEDAFMAASKRLCRQGMSGRDELKVVAACFGLAGTDRATDHNSILKMLHGLLGDLGSAFTGTRITLVNDSAIALAGGTRCEPGVVVIAGTGSIAYGVTRDGRTSRSGGWGHILGDEGSAYDIGRRGLAAALRAIDGRGSPTRLCTDLASALGVSRIEDSVGKVYQHMTRQDIAALAPIVGAAARAGDAVACSIIRSAGEELGMMALAVIRDLKLEGVPGVIVAAGGVLERDRLVRDAMVEVVNAGASCWVVRSPEFPPVIGAVFMAISGLEGRLPEAVPKRVASSISYAKGRD